MNISATMTNSAIFYILFHICLFYYFFILVCSCMELIRYVGRLYSSLIASMGLMAIAR